MAVTFTNPDVAAAFEPLRENDGKIHIPAGKTNKGGYAGLLSGITLEAAQKAVASGSNLLKKKESNAGSNNKAAAVSEEET